ncbi:interferon regulatory factor 7 isoform X2 [Dunckerocampus dactyliophorus]|uniref:interferon regulatory factor 7 isoform X2 n=1 Tax=Dunckerocampus dactyliophorus TaxID=161453 RepID=UPI002406E316|nr:interferon regulatory factor 7 isoform X2 [Dunckerocampus dactyliophorus]
MQRPSKPLFANWLIHQVEMGQCEGLCYVAPNKFRVPWKHNSRKDCSAADTKLFRDWAVVSGKINEFPNNKARWKTNFRCNLNNLQCFKMIEDNSQKSQNPHKIYEIINSNESTPTQDQREDLYRAPPEQQFANNSMTVEPCSHPTEYVQQHPTVQGNISVAAIAEKPTHVLPIYPDRTQYRSIDLEVSIHYRNRQMLKMTVNTASLQLHHLHLHQAPEDYFPLRFPTTEGLLDHKQIQYTNSILNSIQRGLLLEVLESGIYATRQDSCRVFASTDNPSMALAQPRKLPQNTMVELFSFQKFFHELKQYRENNGSSPNYTITMCFGEAFPDGKPLEKKLIVVQVRCETTHHVFSSRYKTSLPAPTQVVPLILQNYHEMAQRGGASSLNSANVSLQFSNSCSLADFIASHFSPPPTEFN